MVDEPESTENSDVIKINLDELGTPQLTQDEEEFFSRRDAEDVRKMQLLNDGLAQDNSQRLDYAEKAYSLVQTWVGFTIVLISCQFGLKPFGFYLEREEFIAVIVSLTGTMFGFWMLVGRYLFPSKPDKSEELIKAARKASRKRT